LKVLVTGGFGFIGSNLITELVANGQKVLTLDNFSTGDYRFLTKELVSKIEVFEVDLSKIPIIELAKLAQGCQKIFHLSANADVREGWTNSYRDIEQNLIVSYKIAELARILRIKEVIFASTGCVYGDASIIPTPENHPMPIQTSLYGNSKAASEGIFSAYSVNGMFSTTVLRFVSVLGKNYHHGHVIDFVRNLKLNENTLEILGNGNQKKSYIDVSDCVQALLNLRGKNKFEVFNIGQSEYITVNESIKIITKKLNINPKIVGQDSERGWVGDNPFTFLDIKKANIHGWYPTINIKTSIENTVDWILDNEWVLSKTNFRSQTKLH